MAKKKQVEVKEVKPLALEDAVVFHREGDNHDGKEGTVKAVSQVQENGEIVNKHTVSFLGGTVRQYVPASELTRVGEAKTEAPVEKSVAKEEVKTEEEVVETPDEEVKEEETPVEGTPEAVPAEEVKTEEVKA